MHTIGVDVGGTNIVAGAVDSTGRIVARRSALTPTDTDNVIPVVCHIIDALRGCGDVAAVGVGAAGFVDARGTTVLFAKHIGWIGEPLKERLEHDVGLPVVVENDANAAAWGEARHGAGQGAESLVCVTIGTGIGGGLIVDGSLLRGSGGVAAELGHLCVVPDGHRCGCGSYGCWEMYGSGGALVREARRRAAAGSGGTSGLVTAAGGAQAITGPAVTGAARAGDPGAIALLSWLGGWIGRGLASLAAVLDPQCFVVGGGVAEAGDLLLDPVRAAFGRHLTGRGYRPEARIVRAALGTDAGVIGAADLARAESVSSALGFATGSTGKEPR